MESAATVCSSAESEVWDWTEVSWAISVMNEVGSVGLVGSWFSSWATSSWRNVWELSSWFRPVEFDVDVVLVPAPPDGSVTGGIVVMSALQSSLMLFSQVKIDMTPERSGEARRWWWWDRRGRRRRPDPPFDVDRSPARARRPSPTVAR